MSWFLYLMCLKGNFMPKFTTFTNRVFRELPTNCSYLTPNMMLGEWNEETVKWYNAFKDKYFEDSLRHENAIILAVSLKQNGLHCWQGETSEEAALNNIHATLVEIRKALQREDINAIVQIMIKEKMMGLFKAEFDDEKKTSITTQEQNSSISSPQDGEDQLKNSEEN